MVADTLKSTSITNLDASPILANTSGVNAPYRVTKIRDSVTPTAAGLADTGSKYKVVRVPTNAFVKKVAVIADAAMDTNAAPLLAFNVGAFYSDSTTDGTPVANQNTVVSGAGAAFLSAAPFGKNTAASPISISTEGGSAWTAAKRQKQLWDALGLTSDPGGFFDVVVAVQAAAATAVSGPLEVEVEYALPTG